MKMFLSLVVICVLFAISCDTSTEPSAKPMIYGTFVDAAGNPIADAEICLIPDRFSKSAINDVSKPPKNKIADVEYFTAIRRGEGVQLKWATSSELNCDHFEIMRAVMKGNKLDTFMTVGTSKANGTSMKTQFYWTTDNNLEINSIYFYKLKIIANDGSFVETDEIQLIIYELLSHLDSHRPNPFFTTTFIEFTLPKSSDIEFKIIEKSSGIEYFDLKMFAESGIHEVEWQAYLDAPNNDSTILRPGVYIANLKTNDTTISKGILLDFKFNESKCEIPLHIIKTDKNGRFEIDWKWVPELAHYTRIAEDGTELGIFRYGDSGEIIARKFVSENDNSKKYLIGRHSVIANRKGELKIKLTAKEVEVQK